MRRMLLCILFGGFLLLFSNTASHAYFESTFDTGSEGWDVLPLVTGEVGSFTWNASGGNPDGNISAEDLGDSTPPFWYFESPSAWSGDFTQYIGGTVEFDIKTEQKDASSSYYTGGVVVALDLELPNDQIYLGWFPSNIQPTDSWTSYSVEISESNFQVIGSTLTFAEAIQDITGVYIRGDYLSDTSDVSYLDNVRISTVPEPSTMLLLASGLVGLAGLRRRFRRG